MDSARTVLFDAADRLERLAARSTPGDWRLQGLLATRPEVVAHGADGSAQHVAEARATSAGWIIAMSPALAGPLVSWLRSAAAEERPNEAAIALARTLLARSSTA